jgi:hypothetical protein
MKRLSTYLRLDSWEVVKTSLIVETLFFFTARFNITRVKEEKRNVEKKKKEEEIVSLSLSSILSRVTRVYFHETSTT